MENITINPKICVIMLILGGVCGALSTLYQYYQKKKEKSECKIDLQYDRGFIIDTGVMVCKKCYHQHRSERPKGQEEVSRE